MIKRFDSQPKSMLLSKWLGGISWQKRLGSGGEDEPGATFNPNDKERAF